MKTIEITQFLRPNGEQREQFTDVSDEAAAKFEELKILGLRLTAELIPLGDGKDYVSVCIEHPTLGDFNTILHDNGPGLQEEISNMILMFDKDDYEVWLESIEDEA